MQFHCDAVLFDLDGVLVDSRQVIRRHWTRWCQLHEMDIEKVLEVAHGRRPVDTVRLLMPNAPNADELAERIVAGEASDAEGLVQLPGVEALINSLRNANWTVATSGPRAIAEFRLGFAGVPILPTIVTAEDVTRGKPDPEPYLLAAGKLQVPAERCVVFEDAPAGVQAGRAAGAQVIGLSTTYSDAELLAAGAQIVVQDLSRIAAQVAADGKITLLAGPPAAER